MAMKCGQWLLAAALMLIASGLHAAELHVSPAGADANPGTKDRPLHGLAAAQKAVRSLKAGAVGPVTVLLHGGTYYLPETLVFTAEDSGTEKAPVVYAAAPGEEVVVSGGQRLELTWAPFRDGIRKAKVPPGFTTDQLFVNGEQQILARYPNYDPKAPYFNGTAADAFSRERAARWSDPRGGFIHAMHKAMWGDFHYLITGKDKDGNVTYEGGWQNNRRMGMHDSIRFVENIFEELDAPGEWFLDAKAGLLYFYPPKDLDLNKAVVEAARLRGLVEFKGTEEKPVRFVTLKGLTFRHAARTFMDNKEPLLRSDWTIYRGGAVLFAGCENCALEDCTLENLGGNAVFVNDYNRRVAVRGCHITEVGANGVAFVGDPGAVRDPLFEYGQRQSLKDIDRTAGPKGNNYPADCLVEDCLIHRTGRVEKQTAPVEIAMSQSITIRYCSIYDVPRAGINIGDGCWGGHVIEFCDVFDTVKETGDHGSFNSWGRDRYWGLNGVDLNNIADDAKLRDLPVLDTVKPIILRDSRWRCDHGWDIDLDDGSTNYHIYNNLCLHGGIKLREGFRRVCENNVMVGDSLHPHVWFKDGEDVVRHNIVFAPYRPVGVPQPWGKECDFNLLHHAGQKDPKPARQLQKQSGRDEHSLEADALFLDPTHGDYRVADDSPALKLGFVNFPMDQFGVRKPELRKIARTPQLPDGGDAPAKENAGPAKPTSHTDRKIEGWTVRVDDRLLRAPNDALGARALRFLEAKLFDINAVVPEDKLKKLHAVVIVLDLTNGKLNSMQYHPDAGWLKANGYSPELVKCVHIPRAADLPTKRNINEQPWSVLHELAHAYHDQVLGFDDPRIREAYEKYKKSGHGEKTLLFDGSRVRHYALTNHKEFFAEMTEAYFGANDFFPFNRGELKEAEPEIYDLMTSIWETPPAKQ